MQQPNASAVAKNVEGIFFINFHTPRDERREFEIIRRGDLSLQREPELRRLEILKVDLVVKLLSLHRDIDKLL